MRVHQQAVMFQCACRVTAQGTKGRLSLGCGSSLTGLGGWPQGAAGGWEGQGGVLGCCYFMTIPRASQIHALTLPSLPQYLAGWQPSMYKGVNEKLLMKSASVSGNPFSPRLSVATCRCAAARGQQPGGLPKLEGARALRLPRCAALCCRCCSLLSYSPSHCLFKSACGRLIHHVCAQTAVAYILPALGWPENSPCRPVAGFRLLPHPISPPVPASPAKAGWAFEGGPAAG